MEKVNIFGRSVPEGHNLHKAELQYWIADYFSYAMAIENTYLSLPDRWLLKLSKTQKILLPVCFNRTACRMVCMTTVSLQSVNPSPLVVYQLLKPKKNCFIEPRWGKTFVRSWLWISLFSLRAKWQIGQSCPRNQTHGNILPPSSCGQQPTIP